MKRVNFAAGWIQQDPQGRQYITCAANGERQKVRLKLELEDGTEVYPSKFYVNFAETKSSEKSPDVSFTAQVEV